MGLRLVSFYPSPTRQGGVCLPERLPCELVRRGHQCAAIWGIERAMPAIGRHDQLGLRPGAMQRPRALHGTDHVVTALHNHTGDVADARGVRQQLVVRFEESLVDEVVRLKSRAKASANSSSS